METVQAVRWTGENRKEVLRLFPWGVTFLSYCGEVAVRDELGVRIFKAGDMIERRERWPWE